VKLNAHRARRLAENGDALRINAQGGGIGVYKLHHGTLIAEILVAVEALCKSESESSIVLKCFK
jgi:hypothetical protein